jgi:glutathionylspermidine amidase/synthetase
VQYNADSASCLLECGYVQHQWAKAVGLSSTPGRDTGDTLFDQLVEAWKKKSVTTTLHLMCDDDDEER